MKIHALQSDISGDCHVVLHTAVPAGNNAVGNSWKLVLIATGKNTSSMSEGVGLGQISTAELAQIVSGDVIEIPAVIPTTVVAAGAVAVNAFADSLIVSAKAKIASELNYFGWTSAA